MYLIDWVQEWAKLEVIFEYAFWVFIGLLFIIWIVYTIIMAIKNKLKARKRNKNE